MLRFASELSGDSEGKGHAEDGGMLLTVCKPVPIDTRTDRIEECSWRVCVGAHLLLGGLIGSWVGLTFSQVGLTCSQVCSPVPGRVHLLPEGQDGLYVELSKKHRHLVIGHVPTASSFCIVN